MRFYLTFGNKNTALRNGWIEVEAANMKEAEAIVRDNFGIKWANIYGEGGDNVPPEELIRYFPLGMIGETLR